MMKKFVVLTLLLAMASFATAGLEVVSTEDTATTGTVGVTGDNIFSILLSVEVDRPEVVLNWDNVAFGTFDIPGKVQNQHGQVGEVTAANLFGGPSAGDIVSGIGFDFSALPYLEVATITVTAINPGTAEGTFFVQSPLEGVIGAVEVIGVPEPMTFALLGLGGLFLRRRK